MNLFFRGAGVLRRPVRLLCTAVVPKHQGELWRVVTGFTTFSARRDVEMFLVEHGVNFSDIDAMLTKHDYCCGKWAVLFQSMQDIQHLESKLRGSTSKYLIESMTEANASAVYASDRKITNRTVKIKLLVRGIRMEDLMFMLEEYGVLPKDIEISGITPKISHYFIHFPNSDAAQRFVLEKNMTYVRDRPVHMVWYDV